MSGNGWRVRSHLVTDFPMQGVLDHLVDQIVGIVPITAVPASDESALRYEDLQTERPRTGLDGRGE